MNNLYVFDHQRLLLILFFVMTTPQRLKGFRDYFGEELDLRNQIITILKDNANRAGFLPIDTPSLEYAQTLVSAGDQASKQLYSFDDLGGRSVCLRYDLTMALSRFVQSNKALINFPFKRYQIGKVWRAEKPQKGRYREFCQADIDILGANQHISNDLEVLVVLSNTLVSISKELNLKLKFIIGLGNRYILTKLIERCLDIDDLDQQKQILIIIDKLDKIGRVKLETMLIEKIKQIQNSKELSLRKTAINNFLNYICCDQLKVDDLSNLEDISLLFNLDTTIKAKSLDQELSEQLSDLKTLKNTLTMMFEHHIDIIGFNINLSLARGLDYYSKLVFETSIKDRKDFGSVCSGGRYSCGGENYQDILQGVGGSIGIDRILAVICENLPDLQHDQLPTKKRNNQELFLVYSIDDQADKTKIMVNLVIVANCLRNQGFVVNYCINPTKISKQYKKADKSNARYAVNLSQLKQINSDELLADIDNLKIKVKDLSNFSDSTVIYKDFVRSLKKNT